MKYIIMFFCIVFCAVGDMALWVAEKMAELVDYGSTKVLEIQRSEPRGAHEKGRLPLICGVESERRAEDDAWTAVVVGPYDWAKEECDNEA